MDWRLITAVMAAIGACAVAGAVAFAVINDGGSGRSAGPKAKTAPPAPMMLAERGAGGSLGAAFDTSNVMLGANNSPVLGQRTGSLRLASLNPSDVDAPSGAPPAAPPIKITAPTPPKDTPGSAGSASGASPSPLKPNMAGVLTGGEIARIHAALRLTPDQELLWPPVQGALSEMGRQQMAQVMRGQKPEISTADWPPQRLYFVAGPLIKSLRPEQKDQIRALCRSMGFAQVASLI